MSDHNAQITVIGPDTRIKGEMSFERTARLLGHFEGRVTTPGELQIGASAHCKASPGRHADRGWPGRGRSPASASRSNGTAKVVGDIVAERLIVSDGSVQRPLPHRPRGRRRRQAQARRGHRSAQAARAPARAQSRHGAQVRLGRPARDHRRGVEDRLGSGPPSAGRGRGPTTPARGCPAACRSPSADRPTGQPNQGRPLLPLRARVRGQPPRHEQLLPALPPPARHRHTAPCLCHWGSSLQYLRAHRPPQGGCPGRCAQGPAGIEVHGVVKGKIVSFGPVTLGDTAQIDGDSQGPRRVRRAGRQDPRRPVQHLARCPRRSRAGLGRPHRR